MLWYPTTTFSHLLSFDHIKLYRFSVSYTAQVFPWVILLDGSLSREQKILNEVNLNIGHRFRLSSLLCILLLLKIIILPLTWISKTYKKHYKTMLHAIFSFYLLKFFLMGGLNTMLSYYTLLLQRHDIGYY